MEIRETDEKTLKKLNRAQARFKIFFNLKLWIKIAIEYILFIPLIKIFRLLYAVLNLLLGVSALTFFYGIYELYQKFKGNDIKVSLTVVSLTAPFVIAALSFILETMAEIMEKKLYGSEQ